MGGMPARVSAAPMGEVLKDPVIQRQARLCIFRRLSRGPFIGAPSYIQSRLPYVAMGRTHALYIMRLCLGLRPRTELPSASVAFAEVRALLVYRLTCSRNVSFLSKKNPRYRQTV